MMVLARDGWRKSGWSSGDPELFSTGFLISGKTCSQLLACTVTCGKVGKEKQTLGVVCDCLFVKIQDIKVGSMSRFMDYNKGWGN